MSTEKSGWSLVGFFAGTAEVMLTAWDGVKAFFAIFW